MKQSYQFYFLLSVFSSARVVLLHHGKSPAPLCHLLSLNFCSVWEAVDSSNHSLTAGFLAAINFFFFLAKPKANAPQMLPGLKIIISEM